MHQKLLALGKVRSAGKLACGIMLAACSVVGAEHNLTVVSWPGNPPPGLTQIKAISAGFFHSLALQEDGTVLWWDDDISAGQAATNVAAISAEYFDLALTTDGTVLAWGNNSEGQTNVPGGLSDIRAVAAGSWHGLALRPDGMVANWGGNYFGQLNQPASVYGIRSIDAGSVHSVAVKSNGTVVVWGSSDYGRLNMPGGLTDIQAADAGWGHTLVLRSNQTVVGWGYNAYGQINIPPGLTNVTAIAAGYQHSVALRADGTVVAWGYNADGETNVPPGLNHVVAISAGAFHTVALTRSPGVALAPQNQSVFPGDDSLFEVTATGAEPLSYQWQFDGQNLAGQTNRTLLVHDVQAVDIGYYGVVVSSPYGSVTSTVASLVFNQPPVITEQPESQAAWEKERVVFSVSAVGTEPLSYQWRFGGTNQAGQTNNTFALPSVGPGDAGEYSVVVSNVAGQAISSPAWLRIAPTFIVDNPEAQVVGSWIPDLAFGGTYGSNYLYKAKGAGGNHVEYTPPITEAGMYQIYEYHPYTRENTTNIPHVITYDGGSAVLEVSQTAGVEQWNLLGAFPLSPAMGHGLRITDAIQEENRRAGADAALFVMIELPFIHAHPSDRDVSEGDEVELAVTATAIEPFGYQWRKDLLDIPAATSSRLILTNVQPSDSGNYDVRVTNASGSVMSSTAVLSVRPFLQFQREGAQLILSWQDGSVLETSTNIAGPYTQVPEASSPYLLLFDGEARFFRLNR